MNGDGLLIILICGEYLGFFSRNVRSFRNDLAHDSTNSFYTEGKRSGINNDDISVFTILSANDTALNSCTVADSLIRVDTSVGLFAIEEFLNQSSDFRDSSGSTDKYDLVDFVLFQIGTLHGQLEWFESFLEEIGVEFLELGSGETFREVITFD